MAGSSVLKSSAQVNFGRSRRSRLTSYTDFKKPVPVQPPSPPQRKPSPLWQLLAPHQKQGVKFALSLSGSFLAFEQRTGKTWCAGEYLWQLDKESILIVGLKTNLRSTWGKFIGKWLPHYSLHYDWDSYNDWHKAWKKAWGHRGQAILLVNYEALPKIITKLVRHKFDVVIYDEVHRIKSRANVGSRYARRLRDVPHRLALSGTPLDDSPNQMWAIMRFVEPEALGVQWADYEKFFTRPGGYMGKDNIFRRDRHNYYINRIKPFVYRVTKEDAGILRTKIRWRPVKIMGDQLKAYRDLERDMLLDVDDTIITTPLKVTQIVKLQQVTGGWIIDEDKELHKVGNAKMKVLHQILMEEDELPIVIFCKFKHEVQACLKVARRFYDRVAFIDGSVKDKIYKKKKDDLRRTDTVEAFQRGEIDVLVCQQRTGGVGLDMYTSSFGIVYSCSHSMIDFDQMASRMDAMGKENHSELLVLFVPGTIDEDIRTAIKMKVSVTTATLNRLRKGDQKWLKTRKQRKNPQQDRPPQRQRPLQRSSTASLMSPRKRA